MVALSIGMTTYNDFDGVSCTIQTLQFYQELDDTELLVVDHFGCDRTRVFVEGTRNARYILAAEVAGTAAKNRVFTEARGEAVLCCDSHILFAPRVIARLKAYYRDHPQTRDLLQGPLMAADRQTLFTHQEPVWCDETLGIWATDPRGLDPEGEPFDIPLHSLKAFSCRKSVWPGFNPAFWGSGGEEGYIHEKFRQRGGRCLCLPWLRWGQLLDRPYAATSSIALRDRIKNYIIGFHDIGFNLNSIRSHFYPLSSDNEFEELVREALGGGVARRVLAPASPTDRYKNHLPLVSCVLPTYGRPPSHQHLVEEAIESFLRQTYPNKELIVLNDCPQQELICDAPGIRVVNLPERLTSLGDKRNVGVELARGELIAPWDDDDISLPWRLSHSVERLGDADYYNPKWWWLMDSRGLWPSSGVGYNMSLYRRSAWETVGGQASITVGEDQEMDGKLRAQVKYVSEQWGKWSRREWYYIYRWGVSQLHLSTVKDSWEKMGEQSIQPGCYLLHPHWRMDYEAKTKQLLERVVPCTSASPPPRSSLVAGIG